MQTIDAKYFAHDNQYNAQTEMRNYYSTLTWPALQLGDFEDWSIVDFTRSFISCSVCNPFEEMSSAAIASNISPMSSISSMLFVFLAAIWMRFRLNLRKMKWRRNHLTAKNPISHNFYSINQSQIAILRIGVFEVGRQKSGGWGYLTTGYILHARVQLPKKAVCVYWENNTTLRLVLTILSAV